MKHHPHPRYALLNEFVMEHSKVIMETHVLTMTVLLLAKQTSETTKPPDLSESQKFFIAIALQHRLKTYPLPVSRRTDNSLSTAMPKSDPWIEYLLFKPVLVAVYLLTDCR